MNRAFLPLLAVAALCVRASAADVLGRWIASWTNLTAWSADFEQVRELKSLARPLTNSGRVWFAAPDRFRWELGTPPTAVAVRDGDALLVLSPRQRRAERHGIAAAGRGPMREAMALLDLGFPRDEAGFRGRFLVLSQAETNGLPRLELAPRDASARRMMPGMAIGLGTNGHSPAWTEMRFADGSVLRNRFRNATDNPELPDGLFSTRTPEGYRETEGGGR
jgi:hypothetical protein